MGDVKRSRKRMDLLERMERAVEKVRVRLEKTVRALEEARCNYAVIGGNAVAAWVASVDESAARNTQDVDVLLEREEFERARAALEGAGFRYRRVPPGLVLFLDGPAAKSRDAVHVVFAGETLITEGWEQGDGSYVLQTRTPDGRVVLGNTRAEAHA